MASGPTDPALRSNLESGRCGLLAQYLRMGLVVHFEDWLLFKAWAHAKERPFSGQEESEEKTRANIGVQVRVASRTEEGK
ncbi:unnamed protein product [Protopolystoma xenopodis]|uniref:Uncharacterized protein n=1 Tax=Protopolystoma xenopodis TaxID=117903 RepID=A0A3S4ZIJ2_9PLAT|nr:unnamed protein product [Protopolystoma xenopodis]